AQPATLGDPLGHRQRPAGPGGPGGRRAGAAGGRGTAHPRDVRGALRRGAAEGRRPPAGPVLGQGRAGPHRRPATRRRAPRLLRPVGGVAGRAGVAAWGGDGVAIKGTPNPAPHLTRPCSWLPAAHLRGVVVTGVSAGPVSFMFGHQRLRDGVGNVDWSVWLVETGSISVEQLEDAVCLARLRSMPLPDALLSLGYADRWAI